MVAEELVLPFTYSAPLAASSPERLFPVKYRIPAPLRPKLKGRRVALVNDVIGAGSAVRGTLDDLRACGARVTVIGALAVAGDAALRIAEEHEIPLESLARIPSGMWAPADCPLCAQGQPLTSPGESGLDGADPRP
jgi:orotate phosphoribosyltransferase